MKNEGIRLFGAVILFLMGTSSIVQYAIGGDDKVIRSVPTTHKVVALTIDDGPDARTTPELLTMLRGKQVKLTLFVLGSNVAAHPEILAQAVADGHEIGAHGYSHKFFNRLSPREYMNEMDQAEAVITAVAPKPTLFRPPGGGYNDGITKDLKKRGYTTILWSVDSRDWELPSVEKLVTTVLKNVQPGSIVLMHDGQYPIPTTAALSIIIDRLRADGYQIVTVSELLQYYEVRP